MKANTQKREAFFNSFSDVNRQTLEETIKFLSWLSTCSHTTRARASCLAMITKRGNVRLSAFTSENRIFSFVLTWTSLYPSSRIRCTPRVAHRALRKHGRAKLAAW